MTINKLHTATPPVQTELGRELLDICAVGIYAGMDEKQIHAALLGRIGVCATSWGNPYEHKSSALSSKSINNKGIA